MQNDETDLGLARFLARLTAEERDRLAELLRQPHTYLAENMTDVLAILNRLDD